LPCSSFFFFNSRVHAGYMKLAKTGQTQSLLFFRGSAFHLPTVTLSDWPTARYPAKHPKRYSVTALHLHALLHQRSPS